MGRTYTAKYSRKRDRCPNEIKRGEKFAAQMAYGARIFSVCMKCDGEIKREVEAKGD